MASKNPLEISMKDTITALLWVVILAVVLFMLVLVAILTLIGLAGLILPIVPGVLFLAMAAWLLAQISDRFAQRLHQSPRWQQASRTWQAQASLSARQRTKFWAWVALSGMVQAMTSLLGMVRRARFSR